MSSNPRPALSYVVNSLNAGGTERLVVEMSRAFSGDYSVEVICLDEPGVWAADLRRVGIPVRVLWRQPGFDSRMPGRLAAAFRAHGTRLVHAHQCTPWFYCALARLLHPAPRLLLEEHGRFFPERDAPLRRVVNRLVIRKLTHHFVAVSDDIRTRLVRYEGLDKGQIEIIYNGVTPAAHVSADTRARLRQDLGFGSTDFLVGTVGRFDPIKNLPMLLEALTAARRQTPRVKGLLVGSGPEFEKVEAHIRAGELEGHVHLTGFRSDARTLAQCLDLFVLSSLSEGTSMALLEAMAARVPVAVTAVGGNPEIVQKGETGWVVDSGDAAQLARAIVEAADDPMERRRRGDAGAKKFEEQFTMKQMIASYARRYRQLLDTA